MKGVSSTNDNTYANIIGNPRRPKRITTQSPILLLKIIKLDNTKTDYSHSQSREKPSLTAIKQKTTTKLIDADEDYGPNLQMSEIDEEELEDLKEKFMQKLNKTADEIMSISQLTLQQNNSAVWFEERRKRITASSFGKMNRLKSIAIPTVFSAGSEAEMIQSKVEVPAEEDIDLNPLPLRDDFIEVEMNSSEYRVSSNGMESSFKLLSSLEVDQNVVSSSSAFTELKINSSEMKGA
ncbi:hypothetical protein ILUMI_00404 [Ignelater luminosus]|uniref:Uncharacterized protein n=1 Tax=Ignelater luminosus TaxID=2038154 RepID=A0A8K0GMN8_IGNLU|nr:hypothetical protein ILUMI_00404 [Ignelater luminosus]